MLFVTGDIHADSKRMWDAVGRAEDLVGRDLEPSDEMLLLGDVGLFYGDFESRQLLNAMLTVGCRWVVLRGNHDARYWRDIRSGRYLGGSPWHVRRWRGGDALESDAARGVLFLPDAGGRYELAGHPMLAIPGAFSVDGAYRVANRLPYEPNEQLSWAEADAIAGIAQGGGIEFVMSHTCPLSWLDGMRDLLLPGLDQSRIDKGMERMMDLVLDAVEPTLRGWWFGHYHGDRLIDGTGGRGRLMFDDVEALPWAGGLDLRSI